MGILQRATALSALVAVALVAAAGAAGAKTVSDAAYAARVCGEIAKVLTPLQELQALDSTDLAAYQEVAVELLDDASRAAEAAATSLGKVTSRSGGAKVARTVDFFFSERAHAFAEASDQIEEGDPGDPSFQSDVRAFVDILEDSPFGFANPFEASTITKKKALARAFDANETCTTVRVEFD